MPRNRESDVLTPFGDPTSAVARMSDVILKICAILALVSITVAVVMGVRDRFRGLEERIERIERAIIPDTVQADRESER